MNRPAHLGVRHVALRVGALEAMKRFYVDVLGYRVEWEPDADNVYLTSGQDNLALHGSTACAAGGSGGHHSEPGGGRDRGVGPLDHLGLLVSKAEDVDAWAAFLESRGVRLDAKPRTHRDGARSLYLSDPEGNRIQIIHHPPIAGER